jgi:hypothetical protein
MFPRRGSRPTWPNGEVERVVKTSFGHMVKCWISKIYLTQPSTEPSTFFSSYVDVGWRLGEHVAHGFRYSCHMIGVAIWFSNLTHLLSCV